MIELPPNVYCVQQDKFKAIPGSPWVYWISDHVRALFVNLPGFGCLAKPVQGLITGDNGRFLRFWWEVGVSALSDRKGRWVRYARGGGTNRWFGNLDSVVNWYDGGREIQNLSTPEGDRLASRPQNQTYYFKEGMTFNRFAQSRFAARWLPPELIFDCNSPSAFSDSALGLMANVNSVPFSVLCGFLNPTLNFQVGDVERTPVQPRGIRSLAPRSIGCIRIAFLVATVVNELTYNFIAPLRWSAGLQDLRAAESRLTELEAQINDEVYRLYGISDEDRAAIEAELSGGTEVADSGEEEISEETDEEPEAAAGVTKLELAVRWVSYAVGIVLGRFGPDVAGELGSAVYQREDFAIGSLPMPDEAEFNELVGSPKRFAYIDEKGGRHVFPAEVGEKLRALADTDGIVVLDEGHPDDLPARVETVLELMLGERGADEVVEEIGGDLRRFFERDFFTKWHVKWYRKRPVYWLLQSPRKLYGLYLFHERLTKDTLFVIQRKYLDRKIMLTRQLLSEKRAAVEKAASARERRALNKEADDLEKLLADLEEFAKRLKAVTDRGYDPHIDDGVILNMAPLWEIIPSWGKEPKKYWDGLEAGDYDWAHIARKYWPDRVKAKCKTDKSLAIAHGLT